MYAREYLSFAVNSEIKPLTVKDIGSLSCDAEDILTDAQLKNREVLLSYLNLANLEVHKKFSLVQKEMVVDFDSNNSSQTFDVPLDFLHVVYAQLPNGREIPINNDYRRPHAADGSDPRGLNRPKDYSISLLFPAPFKMVVKGLDIQGQTRLGFIYAAAPPKVECVDDFLDISEVYTDAILNYIAYKAYASVQGDMQATNNTFYLRFIESCNTININGMANSDNLDCNNKLIMQGFV